MRTSNKILITSLAAFLIFATVSTVQFHRNSIVEKREQRALFTQLEQNQIRTLVINGKPDKISVAKDRGSVQKNRQDIGLDTSLNPETIRISGDTLYINAHSFGYVTLPYLESYLLNGQPQPL